MITPPAIRRLLAGLATIAATAGLALSASADLRAPASAVPPTPGYWLVDAAGGSAAFGVASPLAGLRPSVDVVAAAAAPSGKGVWEVTRSGVVMARGDAPVLGSLGTPPAKPVVGLAASPGGRGYWLVASDGGVFSFGDAPFVGSAGSLKLNRPIVGMASTPSGRGYWLVASDGGIFSYGDAKFVGSTGAIRLNRPIVGMASTPSGRGYWLVASDGGIFAFGDAAFFGSTGALRLAKPIAALAPSPSGRGYWLVGADGGVFNFGDARFAGSAAGRSAAPFVSIVAPPGESQAQRAVRFAFAHLGDPYVYGSNGPASWDCSSLVKAAYASVGVTLPRTSEAQWAAGTRLPAGASLAPGDLVFFGTKSDAGHVGIYIGNDQMIDAPHTGANVRVDSITRPDYLGAVRPTR